MTQVTTRPARKSDAAEIALLVNIALHGGIARGWATSDAAKDTYDPIEVGRLEMIADSREWGWRAVTMAEVDGEVAGMMLGYRKDDAFEPVGDEVTGFMRPIQELEAESNGLWFISMLGVHAKWRGKGIGSELIALADAKGRESRAKGLALIVEDANEGARRLYERRGFAQRDARPMGNIPFATHGRDWLLMVKD